MDNPLISLFVKNGSCFKTSNVASMSKFSLGITSENLHSIDHWKPLFLLFITCQEFNRLGEHTLMQMNNADALEHVAPAKAQVNALTISDEVFWPKHWVVVGCIDNAPPNSMLLFSRL